MFNKSIAVIGSKGGVGKTTSAHMLALGLTAFRVAPILVTTDYSEGRVSLPDRGRPYQTVAGQSGEALNKIFGVFGNLDIDPTIPKVLIVDGGGNRAELDNLLIQACDLAVFPLRDSEEDMRVVSADLQRHEQAFALPNQWPANFFTQAQATAILDCIRLKFPERVLQPVPAVRSSQIFLRDEFGVVDTKLRSICKYLAIDVMKKLGINLFDIYRQQARS